MRKYECGMMIKREDKRAQIAEITDIKRIDECQTVVRQIKKGQLNENVWICNNDQV